MGFLDAVTSEERASVLDTTSHLTAHDLVEPLSNFMVGRVRRTLNGGGSSYGAMLTAVNRDLSGPSLRGLNSGAYTFGVEGPVWNQANAKQASPTAKAAIPCLM